MRGGREGEEGGGKGEGGEVRHQEGLRIQECAKGYPVAQARRVTWKKKEGH